MKATLMLLLLLLAAPAFADLAALDFLVGKWEGVGEHHHEDGRINRFRQTLETDWSEDGGMLQSEQRATTLDEEPRIIFEALVVYSFDAATNEYRRTAKLANGNERVAELSVDAGAISWTNGRTGERFQLESSSEGHLLMTARSGETGEQVFSAEFLPVVD